MGRLDLGNNGQITGITSFTTTDFIVTGDIDLATGATINGETNTIIASTNGSERLRIDSSGDVGIGTENPAKKFDVQGDSVFGGSATRIHTYSDSTYSGIYNGSSLFSDESFYMGGDSLFFRASGTERLRIDSSGNVGIGTDSPDAGVRLQIEDSSPVLRLNHTSSGITDILGSLQFGSPTDPNCAAIYALHDGSTTSGALSFRTESTGDNIEERARIDSVGRLLVGTSSSVTAHSETRNVQVVTDVNNANQGLGIYAFTASNYAPRLDLGSSPNGTINTFTTASSIDSLVGRINFLGSDGDEFLPTARIESRVDGTAGNGDMPGRLIFSTTADGASSPTERMRIDSSGLVGIGTNSPSEPLDIVSAFGSARAIRVRGRSSDNIGLIDFYSNDNATRYATIGAGATNIFVIETANNERLRIDSTGRLLVGTTSSSSNGGYSRYGLIQVEGNQNNSSGSGILTLRRGEAPGSITNNEDIGVITFASNDGNEFAWIRGQADGGTGVNDYPGRLTFSTTSDSASSPTERMRINREGSVVINSTATPANAQLYVSGDQGTNGNGIYQQMIGITGIAKNGIYSYITATTGHPTGSTSYSVGGQAASITGCPMGGTLGLYGSSIYGILGYYTGSQTWGGWFAGSVYASGTYQGSDERLKENIVEIEPQGVLDKLDSIRSVKYTWKENSTQYRSGSTGTEVGFLAQEVQPHFPEVVTEVDCNACNTEEEHTSLNHELGITYGVDYSKMVPILLAALKESKARIETLEAKVAALEGS